MSWRQFLYLCLLTFVVTLAAIIGWRLTDQAMAVIVGVVAGAVASIPTSLIVVWVALNPRSAFVPDSAPVADPVPPQPQVIFVHTTPAATSAPASPHSQRSLTVLPAYAAPEPTAFNGLQVGSRHFTILGEQDSNW